MGAKNGNVMAAGPIKKYECEMLVDILKKQGIADAYCEPYFPRPALVSIYYVEDYIGYAVFVPAKDAERAVEIITAYNGKTNGVPNLGQKDDKNTFGQNTSFDNEVGNKDAENQNTATGRSQQAEGLDSDPNQREKPVQKRLNRYSISKAVIKMVIYLTCGIIFFSIIAMLLQMIIQVTGN